MSNPLVTVAIPTIGRSAYFEETLKSAIKQSYTNLEILISDNASTDATQAICKDYSEDNRVSYFRQNTRLTMIDNWNFLLTKSKGEYFLLLSDDDLLEVEMISQFITTFEKHKDQDISLAYCPVKYIDYKGYTTSGSSGSPEFEDGFSFIKASFLYKRSLLPSATLFKTEVLNQLNGFDKSSLFGTDMITRLNAAVNHNVTCINMPLVKYRRHLDSLSYSLDAVNSHKELFDYFRSEKFIYAQTLKNEIDYYIQKTSFLLIRQLVFLSNFTILDLSKSFIYKSGSKLDRLILKLLFLIPFRSFIYKSINILKRSITNYTSK